MISIHKYENASICTDFGRLRKMRIQHSLTLLHVTQYQRLRRELVIEIILSLMKSIIFI